MDPRTGKVTAGQGGVGETVRPPATDEQVAAERAALRDRFGATPPRRTMLVSSGG